MDRASRFTILLHLPGRHTVALIAAMPALPPRLRRSLTWDQGKEMALHAEISAALDMPVYVCDKASPWQRPSNENTNGRVSRRALRSISPAGAVVGLLSRRIFRQIPRMTLLAENLHRGGIRRARGHQSAAAVAIAQSPRHHPPPPDISTTSSEPARSIRRPDVHSRSYSSSVTGVM